MLNLGCYEAPHIELWQGRSDSLSEERFFQKIKCIDVQNAIIPNEGIALVGFCSDEGIKRNQGRAGAVEGPSSIRKELAKLAVHNTIHLYDLGNIVCINNLEKAQDEFATLIHYCHENGLKTIALGGGHEIAWGHFNGLTMHYPELGIINFDAHFDLRPYKGQSTSGTPFYQIKSYCDEMNLPFQYYCLGIQPQSNTESLFQNAKEFKVKYLTAEEINALSFEAQKKELNHFVHTCPHIYLSLCMDVFDASFAPGVSAPQSLGLTPYQTLPLLKYLMQTGKVVSIDIAEVSPPLDECDKTSKLAASFLAQLLNITNERNGKK